MDSFVSSVVPQTIYLDGMDNSNLAHCVSICYWYENDNRNSDSFFAPAETLECAFYKTMEEIPILAGHIETDSTSRMYVKIDKDNLNMPIYTDVCCDMDYSTMVKNGFNVYKLPMDLRKDFGVPAPPGLIGGQIKLARIRIIRFRNNSGVLVYASIAHGIVDGHGYTQIMNRWAEISRWMLQSQDAKASPFPVRQFLYDRSIHNDYCLDKTDALEPGVIDALTTRNALTKWLMWLSPSSRLRVFKAISVGIAHTCSFFYISAKTMEDLRARVQKYAPSGVRLSINDVLTAYLIIVVGQAKEKANTGWWKKSAAFLAIRKLSGNRIGKPKELISTTATSARSRLNHPDCEKYVGNLYFGKSKTYSQDEFKQELTDKALSDLALKVHQVISSVNEQVIGQFGFLQNKEPDGFMWSLVGYAWERNKLVMTNQSRFDHYGVDFGAGIPKIVRHAPHAFTDTVYVMPVHPETGGYLIEFKIAPKIEANIIRDSRWMKLVDRYDNYM
ncbi:hypothetical protein LPJ72_002276 [Coemansia sp. Benny D160-2]|nr:hypothetical protein LPJ72_002276 [Coemansia sp. Benny D160-2]